MDDVTLGFLNVRSNVRKPPLRTFADLETWGSRGSLNVNRDLKVVAEVSVDGVRLLELGTRGGFMGDGEIVGFARTLVFTRTEVRDVYGPPSHILGIRIVNLDHELDDGPKTVQL